ncbi:MAG: hypothetical protein IPN63_07880 [Gammaproteobacteria bacterium]|nr:hypothetical protein [Gammaproteobacteria bacterium]
MSAKPEWKSDAPTPEDRARHRAWCAFNYQCNYAEYLEKKKRPGNPGTTSMIDRRGTEDFGPRQRAEWREWSQRMARRGIKATVEAFLEQVRGKSFYDHGLRGHPQAIAYKINKKALGVA